MNEQTVAWAIFLWNLLSIVAAVFCVKHDAANKSWGWVATTLLAYNFVAVIRLVSINVNK